MMKFKLTYCKKGGWATSCLTNMDHCLNSPRNVDVVVVVVVVAGAPLMLPLSLDSGGGGECGVGCSTSWCKVPSSLFCPGTATTRPPLFGIRINEPLTYQPPAEIKHNTKHTLRKGHKPPLGSQKYQLIMACTMQERRRRNNGTKATVSRPPRQSTPYNQDRNAKDATYQTGPGQ